MKLSITYFLVLISFYSCNTPSTIEKTDVIETQQKLNEDTVAQLNKAQTEFVKDTLVGTYDLNSFIRKNIKHVKPGTKKHFDWMSNFVTGFHTDLFLPPLPRAKLTLKERYKREDLFKINTQSYLFKEKCIFYVHEVSHANDSLSMKPFIEEAQGKIPGGYMMMRVMLFTMKDDKKANFIDIPMTRGHYYLQRELVKEVYKAIDFVVLGCDSVRTCKIHDLRK